MIDLFDTLDEAMRWFGEYKKKNPFVKIWSNGNGKHYIAVRREH